MLINWENLTTPKTVNTSLYFFELPNMLLKLLREKPGTVNRHD